MIRRLNLILLFALFALSGVAWSQDNGEGWFLQGDPVITKDEEIDLPPCYTDRTVAVTNGEGHGSVKWSAECFKEGSGTYSSDVTWTKPPAYMKPGSNISFSMTFTSPDGIPTGGAIKANVGTIVEGDSRNPQGNSTATYTVPNGSPGNELELYTSFVMISGLHGYVTSKYKYQVAGTTTEPALSPISVASPTVWIPDTEIRPITKTTKEPSSDIAGGTETIPDFSMPKIIGDSKYAAKIAEALNILQKAAPDQYKMAAKYIRVIDAVKSGSGMYVWENPPRFAIGELSIEPFGPSDRMSQVWLAGIITHDATHSKLYQDYKAKNPGSDVPNNVYSGEEAESKCLAVQYDTVEMILQDMGVKNDELLSYIKNCIKSKYWEKKEREW
jgi:hypothetical protein